MPIKQVVCCDKCGEVIKDSSGISNGYAFVGNVHVVNNSSQDCVGGGIVGNNLFHEEEISFVESISYYCRDCTVKVLFGKNYELKRKDDALTRELDVF